MEVGRFELPIQRCKLCVLPVILYPLIPLIPPEPFGPSPRLTSLPVTKGFQIRKNKSKDGRRVNTIKEIQSNYFYTHKTKKSSNEKVVLIEPRTTRRLELKG